MKIKIFLLQFTCLFILSCQTDNLTNDSLPIKNKNIFTGNISLGSQNDVFDLGKKKYSKITGNLVIKSLNKDTSKIRDISPLKDLTEIGSLIISLNDSLSSLNGLEKLKSIHKELTIEYNNLNDIDALKNLETIGEKLVIIESNIDKITSLNNVSSPIGNYVFIEMQNLKSMEGIPDIAPTVSFFKISNTKVKDLKFRSSIKTINGILEILNNDSLTNINGLSNIETIKSDLIIRDNYLLENLKDLENINFVGRQIEIKDNQSLIDFCGLKNIANKEEISFIIEGNGYDINTQSFSEENCSL